MVWRSPIALAPPSSDSFADYDSDLAEICSLELDSGGETICGDSILHFTCTSSFFAFFLIKVS